MSKNIYSILNSTKNNTEEYEPISDMEVNNIMKRFKNEKASTNKRVNIKKVAGGLVAAAACIAAIAVVPAMRDNDKCSMSVSDSCSTNKNTADVSVDDSSSVTKNSFFISASAAEIEEESIVISQSYENGCIPFSGSYFFVHGNNIKNVSVSIDKGELYKADYRDVKNQDKSVLDYGEYIGKEYTEPFNEDRCYGFYFDEDIFTKHETDNYGNFKQAWHDCYDDLDGAVLSISVVYEDGTSDSTSYTLKSGKLELNKETMKPNGNFAEDGAPYIYGVYFEAE